MARTTFIDVKREDMPAALMAYDDYVEFWKSKKDYGSYNGVAYKSGNTTLAPMYVWHTENGNIMVRYNGK